MLGGEAPVTRGDLHRAIVSGGLHGRPVVVHSSLASFGRVEGGAGTVVEAFLELGCTVVVPTFTYGCGVNTPFGDQP